MLEDPNSPLVKQWPADTVASPLALESLKTRHVTLRDGLTKATILPLTSQHQIPASLVAFLSAQLNKEIEAGDTYPMVDGFPVDKFGDYWFQTFAAVMVVGTIDNAADLRDDSDWTGICMGSYYVKPNYPGRSSHVCNAGFLVTESARGQGVGFLLAESYLDWAPKLGFVYSVFNLVYETNVASLKIWDKLGFQRIGRVKGCGRLKSYPGQLVDAIVYGRDLTCAKE
ncbi:hypothetical protein CDD82_3580 [Ophiocordyceps australis]|uniref:N-acetyltransferase domain-containing protein n=1 Tax=Ophiocordyceps australis TaxID=1399860 RepID=A0A2C5Z612_9HYPO|nr:hypothetical protein CDD82_3580 [Ophiocordyceps australis]